jgi:iron complex outermembrane recepter protein
MNFWMKKFSFLLLCLGCALFSQAQVALTGTVKDAMSGLGLPGAAVIYGEGKGTVTDFDGKFEMLLPAGIYTIQATYVGYTTQSKEVKLVKSAVNIDFLLESESMNEVEIIGDIALDRKTPVAFSNITPQRIREELGTQDLPMILNSTPGIHATQTGGGDGDSRVNIRGFNQRNVAVMVDGIPMNDMENGQVYWSNWFGLDVVTQKIQVQRGLGASKLAIPSVGGTINILSEGIEDKSKIVLSTEYGNNTNARATVGYNSGRLAGGWGITSSVSAKYNQGWVDNLISKQFFYFLKVTKEFGNQSLSFTVMGSPQQHYQRPGRLPISYYDSEYAKKEGVNFDSLPAPYNISDNSNLGLRHNQYWGYLERTRYDNNAPRELMSERINYYHKPILNLKHLWTPNSKFALSTILYSSFGNGGGTALLSSTFNSDGQTDFNGIYHSNTTGNIFTTPYDLAYVNDTSQYKSKNYIFSSVNNHIWVGLLSTAKYKLSDRFEMSGGIDARYYHTDRYRQMYDLLGGDYAVNVDGPNYNDPESKVVRKGDKFAYNIRSYVRQGGLFYLAEYRTDKFSTFLNLTGSMSLYNRVDYFALKVNGENVESGVKKFFGGTVKGGFNYNLSSNKSIFCNAGLISRAPMMANTYNSTKLDTYGGLKNEFVKSAELGYLVSRKGLRTSVNFYYSIWNNKPVTQSVTYGTESFNINVPGMNALHKGGEIEVSYTVNKKLEMDGVISIGDWKWTSNQAAIVSNQDGSQIIDTIFFSASGVKVGDAAQMQASYGIRYSPFKGFYIKPRVTYFDKYYSDFNPEDLQKGNAGRQSWKIPSYYTIDLNFGYNIPFSKKGQKLSIKVNLMNITNKVYISDARNNNFGKNFDVTSAGVFMGMGFRWNVGATYTF